MLIIYVKYGLFRVTSSRYPEEHFTQGHFSHTFSSHSCFISYVVFFCFILFFCHSIILSKYFLLQIYLSLSPVFYTFLYEDWATSLSLFTFMHWRRKWQPTPVFLLGESQGRGACCAAVHWVAQSRTRLKWLSSSNSIQKITDSRFSACIPSKHIKYHLQIYENLLH